MNVVFYISALVAVVATAMVVTCRTAIHALLYLIMSLLAVALVFFVLGAPFVAALEVIIYTGAIMVLFVFVMMMLNLGPQSTVQEGQWLSPSAWIGPAVLGLVLTAEVGYVLQHLPASLPSGPAVAPDQVGIVLFGTYLVGVELASILLLAGLVGAYHLGRRPDGIEQGE